MRSMSVGMSRTPSVVHRRPQASLLRECVKLSGK